MSVSDTENKSEDIQNQDDLEVMDDSDEMIYVKMDTFGVTTATNERSFLKTVGVTFCVGVSLWDPDSKVAGILHITPASLDTAGTEPHQDMVNLLEVMKRHGLDPKNIPQLQAHVLSFQGTSNVDNITKKLNGLGIANTRKHSGGNNINFAIDARNGEIFHLTNLRPLPDEARHGQIRPPQGAQLTSDSRSLK